MLNDFSVLFDHGPTPMWIYEMPSLRILKVNESAIAPYGYAEKEFLAMAISDINVLDRENFSNPSNEEIVDHLFTVTAEIDTVIHQIVDKTFTGDINQK